MSIQQKITPCLWFDKEAEEAAKFYVSVFKNSKIIETVYYGDNAPMPKGTVLTVVFELDGVRFTALNGGPVFKFTEAVSLQIDCETQDEVDYFWKKLTADGGAESMCGWLKDKYGLSWQVVPGEVIGLLQDKVEAKASRAWKALMTMQKIDIAAVKKAHAG